MEKIIERLVYLMEKENSTPTMLSKYLNIHKMNIYGWIKRNSNPPSDLIVPICEFYNVSVYWLLTGKESEDEAVNLSNKDKKHFEKWNKLNSEDKKFVEKLIDGCAQEKKQETITLSNKDKKHFEKWNRISAEDKVYIERIIDSFTNQELSERKNA